MQEVEGMEAQMKKLKDREMNIKPGPGVTMENNITDSFAKLRVHYMTEITELRAELAELRKILAERKS